MPPIFTSNALLRLLVVSICAALWLLEHVRLARRAARRERRGRGLLALLLPGAGAVMAWRRGERRPAMIYAVLLLTYVLLRLWPGGG